MNRVFFIGNMMLLIVLIMNKQPPVVKQDFPETKIKTAQLQAAPEIQVNRLPHPFNVDGHLPYQVWVDGERLKLNSPEARTIIKTLNLKFEQPKDTAEIHSGAGWLRPLDLTQTQ